MQRDEPEHKKPTVLCTAGKPSERAILTDQDR
jgi:hypothetical protein